MEYESEMCTRLIWKKTGVVIPQEDIVACHALNKRGADTSYIIRVGNRKSSSAWEVLASGMLTGRNKDTKASFCPDTNVFLNFQLTKRRGDLAKLVRKAKLDKKLIKYRTDQNGRLTVKVRVDTKFEEVNSEADLMRIIANPTLR